MSRNQFSNGFSLIELMVVLGIVAILFLVALPTYNNHAAKARRADARAALIGLSIAMERYYTQQSPSTYKNATVGSGGIFPDKAPLGLKNKYYQLAISTQTDNSFTITATPIGTQIGDECGALSLNSAGVHSASKSNCWE